jgi:phospholipid-binding lipoprotein MlaA
MARLWQHQPWIRCVLPLYAGLMMASSPASAQTAPDSAHADHAPPAATPAITAEPVVPTQPGAATTAPETPVPAQPAPATTTPATPPAAKGDIVVQGSTYAKHDPFRAVNETSYEAIQKSDKLVVAPATRIYTRGVPSPLRRGLHNAVYNLREPTNFVASLMEHKFGRAGQTLVRFTVNSTIGLAGLFDVAKSKPLRIPYRPNGLADVAGFYGIKPGPYFFLPLVGPTTLRDVIGVSIDRTWFPLAVGAPLNSIAFGLGETVIGGLDDRSAIDGQLRAFRDQSGDPYRATRDFYMKRRQQEIDELRHPNQVKAAVVAPVQAAPAPVAPPVVAPAPDKPVP